MSIQEELDIGLERLTLRVITKGLSNKLTAAALRYGPSCWSVLTLAIQKFSSSLFLSRERSGD